MKKRWLLFLFVFILVICTGCAINEQEEQIEYEYTTQEITYSEENGGLAFRKDVECTQGELAKYYFNAEIEEAERYQCIRATERILREIENISVTPEIFVFPADIYDGIYITGNKLFLTQQEWESKDYAANVLLAVFGRCSHYGLAHGYATALCKQFAWIDKTDSEFLALGSTEPYDLNLLCFNKAFVPEESALAAAQIAEDFVDFYLEEQGKTAVQQLLADSDTQSGMEMLAAVLKSYYAENGVEYSPSTVRYGHGGISRDYIVESDFGTFYIDKKWTDANRDLNPLVTENFLHANYKEVKAFFEINLAQMRCYQRLFALDDYKNDLKIIFSSSMAGSRYSFYQQTLHTVYVKNVDSLMHEFIHALTQPESKMAAWEVEGFARYFSYRYDHYGMALLNQDYNNTPESAQTQYVHEYLANIKRPIDMAIDYTELENIAVYSRSYKDPNKSYVAGSSFVHYLVNQYGEERVIQHIYGSKEPLPKPYLELVKEWNHYIESNYSSYSKY